MTHFAVTLKPPQLQALCEIARAAGREVMAVHRDVSDPQAKADGSPVTVADLRSDQVIREGLRALLPAIPVVSEENAPRFPVAATAFFLVDPLDGTREFLAGNGEFTVNIALVEAGEATAGIVFVPAKDELYFAARDMGAWVSRAGSSAAPIRVNPAGPADPLRVLASRSHGTDATDAWLAALGRHHVMDRVGSSLKFCRIAEGAADLYPRLGPTSQWDTAAGQAVLEVAGGAVKSGDGSRLRYGGPEVLNPHFVAMADATWALPPLP